MLSSNGGVEADDNIRLGASVRIHSPRDVIIPRKNDKNGFTSLSYKRRMITSAWEQGINSMGRFAKNFQDLGLLFTTNTVLDWKKIFHLPRYALIIMNSLRYCVLNDWFELYAYVLMPNHLHIILKVLESHTIEQISRDFNKYTAQQILLTMREQNPKMLDSFWVGTKKQNYKIWQEDGDIKNVISSQFLLQKAEYIHNNPLRGDWRNFLKAENPEDYEYSSARFYLKDVEDKYVRLSDPRKLVV